MKKTPNQASIEGQSSFAPFAWILPIMSNDGRLSAGAGSVLAYPDP